MPKRRMATKKVSGKRAAPRAGGRKRTSPRKRASSRAKARPMRAERNARRESLGATAGPDESREMSPEDTGGVVDELARPLGVERDTDDEVITSDEMLSARDRRRWRAERQAEERARRDDGV